MKEGAGDDLLSSLEEETDDEPDGADNDTLVSQEDSEPDESGSDTDIQTTNTDAEIPYVLRRNRVKEARETVGFGLQKETRELEDAVLRDVKAELDIERLPATDLREAAYLAGLQSQDRIKQILLEWGYEHRR